VILAQGKSVSFEPKRGGGVWTQMIKGKVRCNDHLLSSGDGASIEQEDKISFMAKEAAEFLLFDLP
jgi:redox-sensitive bicupin YhaK (pirin superfamily)